METKALEIPFWLKVTLTIKEAAAYSNIGINKIEELLKQPKCDFVLYVGNKKLVKRKEFEQYISRSLEISKKPQANFQPIFSYLGKWR